MGEGGDISRDIPRYRIYENGVFTKELTDVSEIEVSDSGMMLYYSTNTASKTGKFDIKVVNNSDAQTT